MYKKVLIVLLALTLILACCLVGCNDKEAVISDVTFYSMPEVNYIVGQDFKLSGSQILVTYDNGDKDIITITQDMISGFDPTTAGTQYLSVVYNGKSIPITVSVVLPELQGISIATAPTKTLYKQGQNFDVSGGTILVTYVGGATETVAITESMCNLDEIDLNEVGTQVVTVAYALDGVVKTAGFNVTVDYKVLTSFEITSVPLKTVYYVGEQIDVAGGEVFLSYSNGYPERLDMKTLYNNGEGNLRFDWVNTVISDVVPVTAVYSYENPTIPADADGGNIQEYKAHFTVSVMERDVATVGVTSSSTSYLEQLVDTDLDLSGLSLLVTYNNGTYETLNFTGDAATDAVASGRVAVSGYDKNTLGYQTLVFSFYYSGVLMNKTYSLDVNVLNKEANGVRFILPEGTVYGSDGKTPCFYQDTGIYPFVNAPQGVEGWKYVICYNNGTESTDVYTLENASLFARSVTNGIKYGDVGKHFWNIEFLEVEDLKFDFEILPKEVVQADVWTEAGYKTYYNYDITVNGLMLTVTYNSGDSKDVYVSADMVTSFDNTKLGTQTITVVYGDKYTSGFEAQGEITVVKKVKDNYTLSFKTEPKKAYIRDDSFDMYDAVLFVQYDEGGTASTEEVPMRGFNQNWVKTDTALIDGYTSFRNDDGWVLSFSDATTNMTFSERGDVSLNVYYEGLSSLANGVEITLEVSDPISSIEFEDYFEDLYAGQQIDVEGKVVRINYTSGRYEYVSITADMLDYNARNLTLGVRNVTITYSDPFTGDEFTTDCSIEIYEKALVSMELISAPYKTEYLYEDDSATFDFTGMSVKLNYNNGSADLIVIDDDNETDFSVENFATDTASEAFNVQIEYINTEIPREGDIDLAVTVVIAIREKLIASLTWLGASSVPVVNANEGTDFDILSSIIGYSIKAVYTNGEEEVFALSDFASELNVKGYNKNTAVKQYIQLTYADNSNVYLPVEVNMNTRALSAIVYGAEEELEVLENMALDLSGCSLTLVYDNGTEDTISLIGDYINKSAYNANGYDRTDVTLGVRQVGITYTENGVTCTCSITINVIEKSLTSIGVNNLPKIKYIEGEELDLTGGTIALYFNNGTQNELDMSDAVTDSYYVNRTKFDNSEFSGVSKLQTVYIVYVAAGKEFETSYDIIMQDRKDAEVEFAASNVYNFVYGEKQTPAFTVRGYADFSDKVINMTFDAARLQNVTVQYVNVNEYSNMDSSKDYTVLPSAVGEYYIVVSYNADPVGSARDAVHNSFVVVCEDRFVITRKEVYVVVAPQQKIYGTANPQYSISIMTPEKYANSSLLNDKPFAYDDDWYSNAFVTVAGDQTLCYDSANNAIYAFLISCEDAYGNAIDVNTGVGSYLMTISLGTSVSPNYNIVFINNYFVINARTVYVTPQALQAEYGNRSISLKYTTSGEAGNADSGLYATDTLSGKLSRSDPNNFNVGKYAVTRGTLSNSNYNIVFVNDTTTNDGANGVYLTIYKRAIFVKVSNATMIYGDNVPTFTADNIAIYRDNVCSVSAGALYSADTFADILGATGRLVFSHTVTSLSPVGRYGLAAEIQGVTTDSIIDNYDINFIGGFLEVLKRPITVTADSTSKIFGNADPQLTYAVSETLPVALNGSIARQAGEYIGSYTITAGTLLSANTNYSITFVSGTFVITSQALIVRIEQSALTKVFDGKVPTAPKFSLYQVIDGEERPIDASFDNSFITISILEATRNSGVYDLSLTNTNPNYTVSFPSDVSYRYSVTPLSVDVVIDAPDNLPYKGSSYAFDAYVPDNQVMRFYNYDGSVMLDANNEEIRDEIEVVLQFTTGSTAIYVGDYEVYVYSINSENDNYVVGGMISKTFTITPRELLVTINDDVISYGDTIEVEYNNQVAAIKTADYTVSNRIDGSSDVVNFSFKIVSEANGLETAKDVIFDSEGNVDSYDVVLVQPSNVNYTVRLVADYKYKIMPKSAKITIASKFLSKTYDATAPTIQDFSKVSTLQKSNVVFTFTRQDNDGRAASDIGVYNISVSSKDPNHSVYLASAYQYTITESTSTVYLSSLAKSYDGEAIKLLSSNVTISSHRGITPNIRNFCASGSLSSEEVYEAFRTVMAEYVTRFTKNIDKADNIVFTDVALSNLRTNEAITAIQSAMSYMTNNDSVISAASKTSITGYLNAATAYLQAIIAASDTEVKENNLYLAKQNLRDAYNVIESENTYLAFLFEVAAADNNTATTDTIGAGKYQFTFKYNDYNKKYTYNGSTYIYEITKKEVYLGVNTYSVVYGTVTAEPDENSDNYYDYVTKITDATGNRVETTLPNFNPKFTRVGSGTYNVGTYIVSYVESDDLGNNYTVILDTTNYTWLYEITRAHMQVKVDDATVVYGDRVTYNTVNFWSYVSGLYVNGAPYVGEMTSAELISGGIVDASGVRYTARKILGYDGNNEPILSSVDILASTTAEPSAGSYLISASAFNSANYEIQASTGILTIEKAPLTIALGSLVDLSRTYGEALILNFEGAQYSDYLNISYVNGEYVSDYYLGENQGEFTMPTFVDMDTADGVNPFALTTAITASGESYGVGISWDETAAAALNNYYLDGLKEGAELKNFTMSIMQASITITLADGASIIYGDKTNPVPFVFYGFKNGEASTLTSVLDNGIDDSGLLARNVYDPQSVELKDIVISDAARTALSNYTFEVASNAALTVQKRKLYVSLGKTIDVVYGESGVVVEPYTVSEVTSSSSTGEEYVSGYSVESGQYSYWDFVFSNNNSSTAGFAGGEDAYSVFATYGDTYSYLRNDMLFVHTLSYPQTVGSNQELTIASMSFKNGNDFANYEIIPLASKINVFSTITAISVDDSRILLSGDDVNDLALVVTYADGSSKNMTYAELNAATGVTLNANVGSWVSTSKNSNYPISVDYTLSQALTSYNTDSHKVSSYVIKGETAEEDITYTVEQSSTFVGSVSQSMSANYRVRVYATKTTTTAPTLNYATSTMLDASAYTSTNMLNVTGANSGYDFVDASFRLKPAKAANGFVLYIGGGTTTANAVTFRGASGAYGVYVGSTSVSSVSLNGINLFDGYTHNVKAYMNKQYAKLYLYVDGYACLEINLSAYCDTTIAESGKVGISMYGVYGWVRHINVGYRGYYDNLAMRAYAVTSAPLTYYVTGTTKQKSVVLSSVLAATTIPSETQYATYAKQYYVNGVAVNASSYAFGIGSHLVELVVTNGSVIVAKEAVTLNVVRLADTVALTNVTKGTTVSTDISDSDSAVMRSYSYTESAPDYITNTTQEYYNYLFTPSNTTYSSVALTFDLSVSKMATTRNYRNGNSKTFITLWSNNSNVSAGYSTLTSSYYGITVGYDFNGPNQSGNTTLYVTAAGQTYRMSLDVNDWFNNTHTIALYMGERYSTGISMFTLVIYSGSQIVEYIVVDSSTYFEEGAIPQSALNTMAVLSGAKMSIITADTVMSVLAKYNDTAPVQPDFIINNTYTQSAKDGVSLTNETVYTANGQSQIALSDVGAAAASFMIPANVSLDNAHFMFFVSSGNIEIAQSRSVYLEYEGATDTLYFVFRDNVTVFKRQVVAKGLGFNDGKKHTISTVIGTDKLVSSVAESDMDGNVIISARTDLTTKTLYYRNVTISVDNVALSAKGMLPYYNSTTYWTKDDGSTTNTGTQPPSTGDVFLQPQGIVSFAAAMTGGNMKLYGFESQATNTAMAKQSAVANAVTD